MSMRVNILLVAAVIVAVLLRMSVFAVDEREHVIELQFQKIVSTSFEPGLHFKVPFADEVVRYTKTIQSKERRDDKVLTTERKNLVVEYLHHVANRRFRAVLPIRERGRRGERDTEPHQTS